MFKSSMRYSSIIELKMSCHDIIITSNEGSNFGWYSVPSWVTYHEFQKQIMPERTYEFSLWHFLHSCKYCFEYFYLVLMWHSAINDFLCYGTHFCEGILEATIVQQQQHQSGNYAGHKMPLNNIIIYKIKYEDSNLIPKKMSLHQ